MGQVITSCGRCAAMIVYNTNRFVVTEYDGRDGVGYRESDEYGLLCPECGDGLIPDGAPLQARIREAFAGTQSLSPEGMEWARGICGRAGMELPVHLVLAPPTQFVVASDEEGAAPLF